jgi:hypothetical protein
MKTFLALLMIFLIPAAAALSINADTQIVLGSGERQTLSDTFTSAEVVNTVDASSKNVLIVGGPCANALWERYTGMSCGEWPYAAGTGRVLSLENGGVTLVAGTTQQDTERLLNDILDGRTVARQTVSDTSSNQFTITEGQSKTILTTEGRVVITNLVVNNGIASMAVDGERFISLRKGRSITTDDDALIRIISVGESSITIAVTDFGDDDEDTEEITVEEGEDETITISGERIDIEDLSIDDDTLDVTIDGEDFNNLEEGDSDTVGDFEFEVEEIGSDDATFSFEERDNSGLDEGDEFTLREGDDETIEVDGDDIDFAALNISNSTMSITVEGTNYPALSEGSTIDIGDIIFRVEHIEDDEAEMSVDDIE